MKKLLNDNHIEGRSINDQFSADLFNTFLHQLDYSRLYFTANELSSLEKYRTLLDNQLNGEGWTFIGQVVPLYNKALQRAASILQKEAAIPFKFSDKSKPHITFNSWADNESLLQQRWRSKLHQTTLHVLTETPQGSLSSQQFFQKHEASARTRALSILMREIDRAQNSKRDQGTRLGEIYIATIASLYDPHTHYNEITSLDVLKVYLNHESLQFGIALEENERGNIVVASLAPGGPAWKAGVFSIRDELTGLKWANDEVIDLRDLSVEKVNDILEKDNTSALTFIVKKATGEIVSAKLQKEKLSDEQNLVRSFVLEGNGKRIGYILLPDFYTSGEKNDATSARCANDVAKEILNLNKEKIEGLILDVRNNNGGALKEAIALTGIFVDEGALAMMRERGTPAAAVKDVNRGTLYDGPMVLMVNGRSASASEFLAAALQDYRRAIIVGSRTRGKATSQTIHLLDPTTNLNRLILGENIGFSYITTGRIYRVTGKTIQGYGVVPDIALPEFREIYDHHESSRPFFLKPDSLEKKGYYKPLPQLPLKQLKVKSDERISAAPAFQTLKNKMEWYRTNRLTNTSDVDWPTFSLQRKQEENVVRAHEIAHDEQLVAFQVKNVVANEQRLALDPYAKAFYESCVNAFEKDFHLNEGFNIIIDLINLNKK